MGCVWLCAGVFVHERVCMDVRMCVRVRDTLFPHVEYFFMTPLKSMINDVYFIPIEENLH